MPDAIEGIIERMSAAQRDIIAGHLVEVTPEECADLEERGLKAPMIDVRSAGGPLIWPITPLGLQVRERLLGEGL